MKFSRDGNMGAGTTSINGNITNTNASITFNQPSNQFILQNNSLASGNNVTLYVSLSGTATTSNFAIPSGASGALSSLKYDGPSVSSISIIGSSTNDTYSLLAW